MKKWQMMVTWGSRFRTLEVEKDFLRKRLIGTKDAAQKTGVHPASYFISIDTARKVSRS